MKKIFFLILVFFMCYSHLVFSQEEFNKNIVKPYPFKYVVAYQENPGECRLPNVSLPEIANFPPYDGKLPYINIRYEVKLTTAMEKLMYEYDPYFELFGIENYEKKFISYYPFSPYSTPSAIIGDFNGDGKLDSLLHGYNREKKEIKKIVIISTKDGYKLKELDKRKLENLKDYPWLYEIDKNNLIIVKNLYLLQPKGSIYNCGGDSGIKSGFKLKNDGYSLVSSVKKGRLFFRDIYAWNEKEENFSEICGYLEGYYYSGMYFIPNSNEFYSR